MTEPTPRGFADERTLDMAALKGLAHPLRARIFAVLAERGPLTATALGELLGESSGSTSYHLRQLEKHGFVREVEGRGTARERWWGRVPGPVSIGGGEAEASPAGRAAADLIAEEWQMQRDANLRAFMRRGRYEMPEEWAEAAMISTANVLLSAEELQEFTLRMAGVIDELTRSRRDRMPDDGLRRVQVQVNAFPLVDLAEPSDASASASAATNAIEPREEV